MPHVCRYPPRPEEGIRSLGLELQVVVSHPMWVLESDSSPLG